MGKIFATFKSSGNSLCSIDLLKIDVKLLYFAGAANFIILLEISSTPEALDIIIYFQKKVQYFFVFNLLKLKCRLAFGLIFLGILDASFYKHHTRVFALG